jgi:hypothetical protein
LATFTCLDLQQDVIAVKGIAGNKQSAQSFGDDFTLLGSDLRLYREGRLSLGEFDRCGVIAAEAHPVAVCADDRAQFSVTAAKAPGKGLIGVDRRSRQIAFDLLVLSDEVGAGLEHDGVGERRASAAQPFLPKRFSNLEMRPPVSRTFCLPV